MPKSLDTLRADIDRLDDQLLDLIEQRLAASAAVAALKEAAEDGRLKLRPRREAAVIARLTARAASAPPALVGQVWRALMGYGLQAQLRTEIVLHASGEHGELEREVRERFGWAAPIAWAATPAEALRAAREREAVAVVDIDALPLLEGDDMLSIFDSLRRPDGSLRAVAVGRVAIEDSVDTCPELRQCLAAMSMDRLAPSVAAVAARETGR